MIESIRNNPVAWFALVVSIVSAGLTMWRSFRDLRRQSSHDYLNAAVQQLERAYEAFDGARDPKWRDLPAPDRIMWLTVARLLRQSSDTSKRIREVSHRAIYEHSADVWRGKFADLLRPLRDVRLTYFAEDADSIIASHADQRSPISSKSIRVILDFMEWPKGRPDPIADAQPFTEAEIDRIGTFHYRSLGDYLEAVDAMRNGSEDRKIFWRSKFAEAKSAEGPTMTVLG